MRSMHQHPASEKRETETEGEKYLFLKAVFVIPSSIDE